MGFLRVANEAMCRPIREITESKGYEISSHVLAAFGGAGPQHACAIARDLECLPSLYTDFVVFSRHTAWALPTSSPSHKLRALRSMKTHKD